MSVPSSYLQPHEVEALQIRAEEVRQKREINKLLSDRAFEEENKRRNYGRKRTSKAAKKIQAKKRKKEIKKKSKKRDEVEVYKLKLGKTEEKQKKNQKSVLDANQ